MIHVLSRFRRVLFGACVAIVLAALAGALVWAFILRAPGVPIVAGDGPDASASAALPAGCVVVDARSVQQLEAPFELASSPASPDGLALRLADGRGDKSVCAGRATFPVSIPRDGAYRLWLRCRWENGCGNSVGVSVNGSSPVTVGQDGVYGTWHWVAAGEVALATGDQIVGVHEREDGVAVDQLLLSPAADDEFIPRGMIRPGGVEQGGLRRFVDYFDRSPGHGNDDWTFEGGSWSIEFSLDPNRVPSQYSLKAKTLVGEPAVAVVRGRPWRGAHLAMAVRRDSEAMPGIGVWFRDAEHSVAVILGDTPDPGLANTTLVRCPETVLGRSQWQHLEVLRWGWTVQVLLDGQEVVRKDDLKTPGCGTPALLVSTGECVFDDVAITEIPWAGEDGVDLVLPWQAAEDAAWFRPRTADGAWALFGRRGAMRYAPTGDQLLAEAVVHPLESGVVGNSLSIPGYEPRTSANGTVVLKPTSDQADKSLTLAADGPTRLQRVAVRLAGPPLNDAFVIGPYHFSEPRIPDPSDYLDFTPEEWKRIQNSPDAEVIKRKPKFIDVVGSSREHAVWGQESGRWGVHSGCLSGRGPGTLRFWQELEGPLDVSMRVRLRSDSSQAVLVMGETHGDGVELSIGTTPINGDEPDGYAQLPSADTWHEVTARLRQNSLAWTVDGSQGSERTLSRGSGGGLLLKVTKGAVDVDDVVFSVPRHLDDEGLKTRFYAFDHRETNWIRRGNVVDHGGISCALASNWVSILTPDDEAMLIHKEHVDSNVMVSFNIEENTEWLGWDRNPSHIHHPFDSIIVALATDESLNSGYRLVVNANDRRETVLLRNGEQVASVHQNGSFPIHYVGGHAPYRPRRNRICLMRQGDTLTAVINGKTVLTYRDPDPVVTPVAAIGGQKTRANLSRILVRELPAQTEPHLAGTDTDPE